MTLFPVSMLEDVGRLPGAGYSFLKQIASPDALHVRAHLDELALRVGRPVAERWAEYFSSFDNRKFFQAFAEAASASLLLGAGWSVPDLAWPGPGLALVDPDGGSRHGMVLSFVRQSRPDADQAAITRLIASINRISTRARLAVHVQRPLPHDLLTEPIRAAVELWLREVDRGLWRGRYAAYEDKDIALEFALTGERANQGQDVVAFVLGPYQAHSVMEAVGGRLVRELDLYRHRAKDDASILAICASDQPWRLPRGYLRELLYGKPVWQQSDGGPLGLESAFGNSDAPSLFRDPLYRAVCGVMMLERSPDQPGALRGQAFQNPWASVALAPARVPVPTLGVSRWEDTAPVLRWHAETSRGGGAPPLR